MCFVLGGTVCLEISLYFHCDYPGTFFARAVNKFSLYVCGEKTVGVDCCRCVFAFPE